MKNASLWITPAKKLVCNSQRTLSECISSDHWPSFFSDSPISVAGLRSIVGFECLENPRFSGSHEIINQFEVEISATLAIEGVKVYGIEITHMLPIRLNKMDGHLTEVDRSEPEWEYAQYEIARLSDKNTDIAILFSRVAEPIDLTK